MRQELTGTRDQRNVRKHEYLRNWEGGETKERGPHRITGYSNLIGDIGKGGGTEEVGRKPV